ncbi:MAG: hypothetical protein KAW67_07145 [Candidatus Eisenbacteria sp.]|nr:hypothetical protein [Candidatus Eisenbacteria bacterium]
MKTLFVCVMCLAAALTAAANVAPYHWEAGDTVLGLYGTGDPPIIVTNVGAPDPVHWGARSIRLEDNSPSGTPQAYIAWVTDLVDGDVVEACVWRYDTTPGGFPSCRISAHWNDDPWDVYGYAGYAGGNLDYGPGEGWDETCHSWTMADGHTGLVIAVRTYSGLGDTVWIDDFTITAPPHAFVIAPAPPQVPVEDFSWAAIKVLFRP